MKAIMPKGPQGQKRPADVIGAAIRVARIATGEEDESPATDPAHTERGKRGAEARAKGLTDAERQQIAEKAAKARWGSKTE
jgi:hypothetical protein